MLARSHPKIDPHQMSSQSNEIFIFFNFRLIDDSREILGANQSFKIRCLEVEIWSKNISLLATLYISFALYLYSFSLCMCHWCCTCHLILLGLVYQWDSIMIHLPVVECSCQLLQLNKNNSRTNLNDLHITQSNKIGIRIIFSLLKGQEVGFTLSQTRCQVAVRPELLAFGLSFPPVNNDLVFSRYFKFWNYHITVEQSAVKVSINTDGKQCFLSRAAHHDRSSVPKKKQESPQPTQPSLQTAVRVGAGKPLLYKIFVVQII